MKKPLTLLSILFALPLLFFGVRYLLIDPAGPKGASQQNEGNTAAGPNEQILNYPDVGDLHYFKPVGDPSCAVVLVSGLGGWKGEVVDIGRRISAENNCLVAGMDLNEYLKHIADDKRFCPGADLTHANVFLQKTLGTKKYLPAVAVGYGEGSTAVYVALAEIPLCFLGGVGFGFCPDFPPVNPPCQEPRLKSRHFKDQPGLSYLAFEYMTSPFGVIAWPQPKTCSVENIGDYINRIPGATYAAPGKDWMPQFKNVLAAAMKNVPAPPKLNEVADLPLYEYPKATRSDTMFIVFSGDGGWVDLSRDLSDYFGSKDYAVVGFDSLQYYWNLRKGEHTGRDLDRLITTYLSAWKKQKAVLVGYSFGADVIPIMLRHLSPETRKKVAAAVLIGPSVKTELEFNVVYLERDPGPPRGEPLFPMFKHFTDTKILCIGGLTEHESLCRRLESANPKFANVDVDMLVAGHMFGGNPDRIGDEILTKLGLK